MRKIDIKNYNDFKTVLKEERADAIIDIILDKVDNLNESTGNKNGLNFISCDIDTEEGSNSMPEAFKISFNAEIEIDNNVFEINFELINCNVNKKTIIEKIDISYNDSLTKEFSINKTQNKLKKFGIS
jgi:hypothetical protein